MQNDVMAKAGSLSRAAVEEPWTRHFSRRTEPLDFQRTDTFVTGVVTPHSGSLTCPPQPIGPPSGVVEESKARCSCTGNHRMKI